MRARHLISRYARTGATAVLSVALLGAAPGTRPAPNAGDIPRRQNEFGWEWESHPRAAESSIQLGSGKILRVEAADGQEMILYLTPTAGDPEIAEHRPVAFGPAGERIDLVPRGSIGNDSLSIGLYALGRAAATGQIAIGIEKLTKTSLRTVVAPTAAKGLREAGAPVLPFPELDRPYDFELTTLDGKRVSSRDRRGKVVLVDFWATWCSPCMAKMAHLKDLYARLHERGFEVVGMNHDKSLEDARRGVARQQLPWPNVLAPTDAEHRRLWQIATGSTALPTLLVIDRQGILRARVSPGELEATVERLVNPPDTATSLPASGPERIYPEAQTGGLIGSWKVLEVARDGQPVPLPPGASMALKFSEDGKLVLTSSGGPGGNQKELHMYVLNGSELTMTDSHDKTNSGTVTFEGNNRVVLDVAGVGRFTMQR